VIYFITDNSGHVKVGYTDSGVSQRMGSLQTGNPRRLSLLLAVEGSPRDEKAIHQAFHSERVNREWFKADGRMADFIGLLSAAPSPEAVAKIVAELPDYRVKKEQRVNGTKFDKAAERALLVECTQRWHAKHGYAELTRTTRLSPRQIKNLVQGNSIPSARILVRLMERDWEPFEPFFGAEIRPIGTPEEQQERSESLALSAALARIGRELTPILGAARKIRAGV
jgi:hypothetical protein